MAMSKPIPSSSSHLQLVSCRTAADLLGMKESGIRAWIYKRQIPSLKLGRQRRIRLSDI
jgi:excisionase family DNA binding protein